MDEREKIVIHVHGGMVLGWWHKGSKQSPHVIVYDEDVLDEYPERQSIQNELSLMGVHVSNNDIEEDGLSSAVDAALDAYDFSYEGV